MFLLHKHYNNPHKCRNAKLEFFSDRYRIFAFAIIFWRNIFVLCITPFFARFKASGLGKPEIFKVTLSKKILESDIKGKHEVYALQKYFPGVYLVLLNWGIVARKGHWASHWGGRCLESGTVFCINSPGGTNHRIFSPPKWGAKNAPKFEKNNSLTPKT